MKFRVMLRRLCPLVPAVAGVLCLGVCRLFPAVAEWVFARGVLRGLSAVLGTVTQYVPFSLAELLVVLALPAVVGLAVWAVCRPAVRMKMLRGCAWCLSSAFLLYVLMHGAQYARLPLAQQMGLSVSHESSVERLAHLTAYFAENASAARVECKEDAQGCLRLPVTTSEALKSGGEGYVRLAERYPFLHGAVNRAKGVVLSHWWSYTGITGMYFPLTAEANVNVDVPPDEMLMTVSHELAHTRGYAHEDECNFLGILACVNHPAVEWQYAGWLAAYQYTADALYAADADAWREVAALCSDGVRRDLARRAAYWSSFEGPVEEISAEVNNAFIQANGDSDGVARYGQVTALLMAYYADGV